MVYLTWIFSEKAFERRTTVNLLSFHCFFEFKYLGKDGHCFANSREAFCYWIGLTYLVNISQTWPEKSPASRNTVVNSRALCCRACSYSEPSLITSLVLWGCFSELRALSWESLVFHVLCFVYKKPPANTEELRSWSCYFFKHWLSLWYSFIIPY